MKTIFIFLMLLFTQMAFGFEALRIENVDIGKDSENTLIYFEDGRVGFLNDKDGTAERLSKGQFVRVKLSPDHTILSLESASSDQEKGSDVNQPETEYIPTILPNLKAATAIFKKMNRKWTKSSECYNRAHIWNYEEYQRSGLKSKKVFIFFTSRYIRKYNFKWWFHAIPTVLVKINNSIVERALDPRYVSKPLPMKIWSDVFVKTKRACPVITKYSTYYENQLKEDCYFHYSSMYMWKPRDLEVLEMRGESKDNFVDYDIRKAYKQGFNTSVNLGAGSEWR